MGIPANIVIMWSGAINEIPNGWFLCDGNNGTPDLRNRFVVGSGSKYTLQEIGGSANSVIVSHTHSVSIATDPNHTHNIISRDPSNNTTTPFWDSFRSITTPANAAVSTSNGGHSHTIGIANAGSQSGVGRNMPPYYALAYIMFGGQ